MTTVDSAKDMDSIRKALGQKKITYYGFSYGTYLGQVYSTLFPSHVRRLIMDSNVDPRRVWYAANLDQDIAFNRNAKIWFAWIAKYDGVYHLGATERAVEHVFYATERELGKNPAGGQVGPDEWADIFLYAGYFQQFWLTLGQAFSDWVNNHDTAAANQLISLYQALDGVGDDNGFAVYLGGRVHGRPLAAPLEHLEQGQLADLPGGSVRDLAECLVQRAMHLLARAVVAPGPHQRQPHQERPADRRDA
jgi:pimeloyl-ACP methyl ester carboxylesterase